MNLLKVHSHVEEENLLMKLQKVKFQSQIFFPALLVLPLRWEIPIPTSPKMRNRSFFHLQIIFVLIRKTKNLQVPPEDNFVFIYEIIFLSLYALLMKLLRMLFHEANLFYHKDSKILLYFSGCRSSQHTNGKSGYISRFQIYTTTTCKVLIILEPVFTIENSLSISANA